MEPTIRISANIIYNTGLVNEDGIYSFNNDLTIDELHLLEAFLKDSPLIMNNIDCEDFFNFKLFTIRCYNEEEAQIILHGLYGCVKNPVNKEHVNVFIRVYYDNDKCLFTRGRATKDICDKISDFIDGCPYVRDSSGSTSTDTGEKSFRPCCVNKENAIKVFNMIEDILKSAVEDSTNKNDDYKDNTPKNNSVSSEIEYITKNLDDSDLFLQMAEEAAELSQACLKYVRAHKGNNPTKDTEDVYLKNIIEELTDVRVCTEPLNIEEDLDIYLNKIHRWADRIRKKNGGSTK